MINNRLSQLLGMLDDSHPDAFLLFAIAKEYEGMEKKPEALQYYLQLKTHHPDYVGLYYHLAALYLQLNDKVEALKTYEDGISLATRLSDFHARAELMNARQNMEVED